MIVHDEESMEQALQMLEASPQGIRYSDQYAYIIITARGTLEWLCERALRRNDIAIVVPRGDEAVMEEHSVVLTKVRRQRAVEEKKKIKEWVREHPEQVAKFEKRLKK